MQGGGRSSARETIGRVAAGAIAKQILKKFAGTEVLFFVEFLLFVKPVFYNKIFTDTISNICYLSI